jgi:hypothetical protein
MWPGREADHSPTTSAEVKENMDLYIRNFTFYRFQTGSGAQTQLSIHWVSGATFPGVKLTTHVYLLQVLFAWNYTSTPPYVFMASW